MTEEDTEPTWKGCEVPPEGWWCSREPGHDGPCAARPSLRSRIAALEAVIRFVREEAAAWQNAPHGEVAPVTGVGDVFANLVAVAPSTVLDQVIREAKAEAVEAARDAIMPPVNWNLRPDGTEMPGTQHIDEALHDIHVQLSAVAAEYRNEER